MLSALLTHWYLVMHATKRVASSRVALSWGGFDDIADGRLAQVELEGKQCHAALSEA